MNSTAKLFSHTILYGKSAYNTGGGSGIIISGGTGTKIINNIISDNSGYGIEEKDTSSDPNTVEYNLFYNNKSGHYLDKGTKGYKNVKQTKII